MGSLKGKGKKEKIPAAKIPDPYEPRILPACMSIVRDSLDHYATIRCARCSWLLSLPIPIRGTTYSRDEFNEIIKTAFAKVCDSGGYIYRDGEAMYCSDCVGALVHQDMRRQKTHYPVPTLSQANYMPDNWSAQDAAASFAIAKAWHGRMIGQPPTPIGTPLGFYGVNPTVAESKPGKFAAEMTVKDHLNEMKRKEKEGIV